MHLFNAASPLLNWHLLSDQLMFEAVEDLRVVIALLLKVWVSIVHMMLRSYVLRAPGILRLQLVPLLSLVLEHGLCAPVLPRVIQKLLEGFLRTSHPVSSKNAWTRH